jgi:hypothetical protein
MAGRRFEVADVVEVLQHWQAGGSVRHLARSLGMGRDRVRGIIAGARTAGLSPGGHRSRVRSGRLGFPSCSPLGSGRP